ncbi:MAG: mannose-1-phosphate guanylyltransferase [Fimbriimonadaceae bacterium]|nr:mannose-1-phosphate guanylyltransferase [Fimbriimonadaceae bacterium]
MTKRLAIIMAGGSGERFWPVSRTSRPKQLLRLADPHRTLLEQARDRIEPLVNQRRIFMAVGKDVEFAVIDADLVPPMNVLVEPAKRNTLGCLCWAAANLMARELENPTIAVLTADHLIADEDEFRTCVERAFVTSEETGGLVTIGIKPTRPETGYGYIETSAGGGQSTSAFGVASFHEKPTIEVAERFVGSGNHYWNSGMFFWTLDAFMKALSLAQPEIERLTAQIANSIQRGDKETAILKFEEVPNISIDYALMEKATEVYMVPGDFGWDDIGAWDSLSRTFTRDDSGNVTVGEAQLIDTEGSIVYNAAEGMTVGVLGMKDVIVVTTGDAVLVLPKDQAQRVKEIVAQLKESGSDKV